MKIIKKAIIAIMALAFVTIAKADEPEGGFCHPGELAICPARCIFIKAYRWEPGKPPKSCNTEAKDGDNETVLQM